MERRNFTLLVLPWSKAAAPTWLCSPGHLWFCAVFITQENCQVHSKETRLRRSQCHTQWSLFRPHWKCGPRAGCHKLSDSILPSHVWSELYFSLITVSHKKIREIFPCWKAWEFDPYVKYCHLCRLENILNLNTKLISVAQPEEILPVL